MDDTYGFIAFSRPPEIDWIYMHEYSALRDCYHIETADNECSTSEYTVDRTCILYLPAECLSRIYHIDSFSKSMNILLGTVWVQGWLGLLTSRDLGNTFYVV